MSPTFRMFVAAAFAAALAAGAAAAPAQASHNNATRWFPLEAGNEWRFESASGETHAITCDYEYGPYRYMSGLAPFREVWLAYSGAWPTNLYIWNPDSYTWSRWARFGAYYSPWTWRLDDGGCGLFFARWVGSGLAVSTPAGDFRNCRKVSFALQPAPNVRCAGGHLQSVTFAPGVGPVEIEKNGVTYRLVSATVGGVSYPSAPPPGPIASQAFAAAIASDRARYAHGASTAIARFTLTVRNTSGQPQTLTFRSGQQFDFEILDAQGNVVRAWSDGRYFTMALGSLTFAPGETKTFSGDVALEDRSGRPLDGTYSVRGRLTNSDGSAVHRIEATAQIEVAIR